MAFITPSTENQVSSKGKPETPAGFAIQARLSLMMMLEFMAIASWFATLGLVLAKYHLAAIIGEAYLLSATAGIFSLLLVGAIADRFLAPRSVMVASHLACAAIMAFLPRAVAGGNASLTLSLIFAYMLLFQPTLGLVNSFSLSTLGDRQARFPYVRVFAPIGWVVAGLGVGWSGLSASIDVFWVASGVGLVLALFSLTLPGTPPPAKGARFTIGDIIGVHALVLFKSRSFAVLMACTLMTSVSLGIYNSFASVYFGVLGISNVAGLLTIGQISEVLFIMTIPFAVARMGMKFTLLVGMAMWGVRFALFAAAAGGGVNMAIVGVMLHGICNDYFVIIAAMYIARIVPPELAAQAQNWLILMVMGFGQAIGGGVAGAIYSGWIAPHSTLGAAAWTPLWLVPIALAATTSVLWQWLFNPRPELTEHTDVS